jgi:hypothetical protein
VSGGERAARGRSHRPASEVMLHPARLDQHPIRMNDGAVVDATG